MHVPGVQTKVRNYVRSGELQTVNVSILVVVDLQSDILANQYALQTASQDNSSNVSRLRIIDGSEGLVPVAGTNEFEGSYALGHHFGAVAYFSNSSVGSEMTKRKLRTDNYTCSKAF